MMDHSASTHGKNRGAVLIVSLIFLSVLTVVAVSTMMQSGFEVRMSTNAAFETRAFNASEAGRSGIRELVIQHTDNDGIWSGITVPSYIDIESSAANLLANSELKTAGVTAAVLENRIRDLGHCSLDTLDTDFELRYDAAGDGDASDEQDLNADIKVVKLSLAGLTPGTGGAMIEGYSGVGRGAGSKGAGYIYYEVRSVGSYAETRAVTAGELRIRR